VAAVTVDPGKEVMDRRPVRRNGARARLRRLLARGLPAIAFLMVGLPHPDAVAQEPSTLERRVKAAFLYQFLSYITWPEQALPPPGEPLVIGVMGAPDIADELGATLAGRTAQGRPVVARAMAPGEPSAGLHMLFIDRSQQNRLREEARAARESSTLPVSEVDGALDYGVVINFVTVEGRVRFEVSLDNAQGSGITISSRLLALAYRVVGTVN
jgi:hypothetical protein